MATIKEMIDQGKLDCRPTGGEKAIVILANYDQSTGQQLEDNLLNVSVRDLEQQLANDDAAVKAAEQKRQNTADLLDHVKPLIETENVRRNAEVEEQMAKSAAAKAKAEAEAAKPVKTKHKDKPIPE